MKKIAVVAVSLLALTGCSVRNVDLEISNAQAVPGAKGLYRFCDQSTLIYFTSIQGSSDEYDAYFYGGCAWDEASGKFLPAIGADTQARNAAEDEMNQQQDRE